ncbi:MAG: TPM domain-containing protein [Oscillibacter sp.]|nr:TPM domain-containing protein [Oscillibacter sp.]
MKRFYAPALAGLLLLFCLTLSVPAAAFEGAYVLDESGILSDEEARTLEDQAASMAQTYQFGVYLVTVDDFTDYGFDDVYDCAVAFYEQSELGFGDDYDGELLFMSMSNRKYALVYTGYGDTAFTELGRDQLEEAMLDCFRNDDWYNGFKQYMDWSEYLLSEAANGEPVGWDESGDYHPNDADYDDGPGLFEILIFVGVPLLISGVVCGMLALQLVTVHEAAEAREYAVEGSLQIRAKSDRFTHATETRVKIESDSDGGSSHHSGGGHSGRSGSF